MAHTLRDKVVVSAYVKDDIREELVRRAEESDRSLSYEIGRVLAEYLEERANETDAT